MIELDGSQGEGGGQVLRSALTLSMITQQPFRIENIRANRPKPGLMRQHLVAVTAAAEVCGARTGDIGVGARTLQFEPGPVRAGDYRFAIGTAGSCTLVLQTVLPALLYASAPSTVRVEGGTHNPKAPPVEFLQRAYGRLMARMGAQFDIRLVRHGFYPAGGGVVEAGVAPLAAWRRIDLPQRGERVDAFAESVIAGVPEKVAARELECIQVAMGWSDDALRTVALPREHGPGNVLLLTLDHAEVCEVFASFGEKAIRAEAVAKQLVQEVRRFMASGAAVGEYLGDQLMLPMALAGGGSFTVEKISQHAITNADVISRFLPVRFEFSEEGAHASCKVVALQ